MLIKKRLNKGLYSEVDDSTHIVYDFRLRSQKLFENYRAISYKNAPTYDLKEIKKENADILASLIETQAVDAGNEDCLIDKILEPVRNGLIHLDKQYLEHMDFYTRKGRRAIVDSADIGRLLEFWEEKEDIMLKEHEQTKALWNRYCGYEQGGEKNEK